VQRIRNEPKLWFDPFSGLDVGVGEQRSGLDVGGLAAGRQARVPARERFRSRGVRNEYM